MNTDPTAIAVDVARYVAIVGAGIPLVWAIAEGLGKLTRINEGYVAAVMGPLYATLFLLFGWLPLLPVILEGPRSEMAVNVVWAALTGLASAFGAKKLNDKLMRGKGWKLPTRD